MIELHYELNRRQRLGPHLALWLPYLPAIVFALLLPPGLVWLSLWFLPLALLAVGIVWGAFGGFFIGLLDVLCNPTRTVDLVIEGSRLGSLDDGERRWIPLAGVVSFGQSCGDTWTLLHDSGIVAIIPAAAITEGQVQSLRSAITEAKTAARRDPPPA